MKFNTNKMSGTLHSGSILDQTVKAYSLDFTNFFNRLNANFQTVIPFWISSLEFWLFSIKKQCFITIFQNGAQAHPYGIGKYACAIPYPGEEESRIRGLIIGFERRDQ